MSPSAIAALLKALSTPRRVRVLQLLMDATEPISSGNLASLVGIGEGPMSTNLTKLSEVGLILRQPHHRNTFYSVNTVTLKELRKFLGEKESPSESK